jgi:ABC-type multidrug transport system fused ATPase/permease subunit
MLDFSATTLRHKICAEAMQGVKDYKLRGTEPNIINRYSEITQKIAKTRALADAIIHLPYFALEALAFSAILLIIVYLLLTHHRITDTIPLLGIYVFACYRFLPALQQIFLSIASIRMRSEAVNNLVNELKHYRDFSPRDGEKKLALQHELVLRNVSFNYPDSTKPTIQQISINVPANKTIGLIGNSGAGKTTTADLILGLLIPSQGEITIDGIPLTEKNITEWQNNIGYVAQNFYLLDDTIAANIALGLQGAEINMQKVISAAKLANIHHYIMQELCDQYATIIGERGIRLSGGQRQRIAIARALYHNPDVLILDEATSALDNETENVILEAIQQLLHQKTIILIAHRLTTIKVCEEVFLFNNGRVVDRGSYEYLSLHSEYFRKFAALNNPLTSHTDITID